MWARDANVSSRVWRCRNINYARHKWSRMLILSWINRSLYPNSSGDLRNRNPTLTGPKWPRNHDGCYRAGWPRHPRRRIAYLSDACAFFGTFSHPCGPPNVNRFHGDRYPDPNRFSQNLRNKYSNRRGPRIGKAEAPQWRAWYRSNQSIVLGSYAERTKTKKDDELCWTWSKYRRRHHCREWWSIPLSLERSCKGIVRHQTIVHRRREIIPNTGWRLKSSKVQIGSRHWHRWGRFRQRPQDWEALWVLNNPEGQSA